MLDGVSSQELIQTFTHSSNSICFLSSPLVLKAVSLLSLMSICRYFWSRHLDLNWARLICAILICNGKVCLLVSSLMFLTHQLRHHSTKFTSKSSCNSALESQNLMKLVKKSRIRALLVLKLISLLQLVIWVNLIWVFLMFGYLYFWLFGRWILF